MLSVYPSINLWLTRSSGDDWLMHRTVKLRTRSTFELEVFSFGKLPHGKRPRRGAQTWQKTGPRNRLPNDATDRLSGHLMCCLWYSKTWWAFPPGHLNPPHGCFVWPAFFLSPYNYVKRQSTPEDCEPVGVYKYGGGNGLICMNIFTSHWCTSDWMLRWGTEETPQQAEQQAALFPSGFGVDVDTEGRKQMVQKGKSRRMSTNVESLPVNPCKSKLRFCPNRSSCKGSLV